MVSCVTSNAFKRRRKTISAATWYVLQLLYVSCLRDADSLQVAYARCHLDWARKSLETWTEARDEVDKIAVR